MFNCRQYKNLLREISGKYDFLRFDDKRNSKYRFYLRHDVDISPFNALKLGKIESSLNIKANYFFQIGAETYNIFSDSVVEIIEKLRGSGHLVGLHIDEAIFGCEPAKILNTVEWFSEAVTDLDYAVSFHRPTALVLGKKYPKLINVYQDDFFSPDIYLSDSRRDDSFYAKLSEWIGDEKKEVIQLLLHPEWWCGIKENKDVYDEIIGRRNNELNQYLSTNYNKVFGKYVKNENRHFRV